MSTKDKGSQALANGQAGFEGHRARLRQRFLDAGLSGFAPHEALELLLTFVIPRKDVKPIAKELIRQFGSFGCVLEAAQEDLMSVSGVGQQAATLIALLLPLMRQYQLGLADGGQKALSQDELIALCRAQLVGQTVEKFLVVSLDARGRLIRYNIISSGDEGETAVYPRLIAAELLRAGASACVIAHNHPSGLAEPSRADGEMTRALKQILEPLSIRMADHVIIAGNQAFSFTRAGTL